MGQMVGMINCFFLNYNFIDKLRKLQTNFKIL